MTLSTTRIDIECLSVYKYSDPSLWWHISAITCQIVMSNCQIFVLTYYFIILTCHLFICYKINRKKCSCPVYVIQITRNLSDKTTQDLTSQHKDLTTRHHYLTGRHHYLTSWYNIWQEDIMCQKRWLLSNYVDLLYRYVDLLENYVDLS